MKALVKKYGHIWVMAYFLIYMPWFFWLEEVITPNTKGYTIMHVALDDYIPFNEYFIIPYLLWFVYIFAAFVYFFFHDKEGYFRMCKFLFAGMTICLAICTIFPNGTDLRVPVQEQKNLCSRLVAMIHAVDTSTNVFPSIHVYNSIGVHIALMNNEELHAKRWIRIGSLVLMLLICLSTVFLKQHSVIDGVGAIILSRVVYQVVYGTGYLTSRRTERRKVFG